MTFADELDERRALQEGQALVPLHDLAAVVHDLAVLLSATPARLQHASARLGEDSLIGLACLLVHHARCH